MSTPPFHVQHIAAYYERLAELTSWQFPEYGHAMIRYFMLAVGRIPTI